MGNETIITSGIFKMSATNFMLTFIFRYAWIWILALSMVGVAGLVTGIVIDLRWFIVGLMIILIVLPMIAAYLYYSFALRVECFVNTVNHTVSCGVTSLEVKMYFDDKKTRSEFFEYSDLNMFQINAQSLTIPFAGKKKGYIWIPMSAFENEDEFYAMADCLRLKLSPSICTD